MESENNIEKMLQKKIKLYEGILGLVSIEIFAGIKQNSGLTDVINGGAINMVDDYIYEHSNKDMSLKSKLSAIKTKIDNVKAIKYNNHYNLTNASNASFDRMQRHLSGP